MALAHTLYAKVGPHHRLLTGAAYLAALIVTFIFPSFDRRTEIEEHGLIPGYATSGIEGEWPGRIRDAIKKFEGAATIDAGLETALLDAELIAHRMNFTVLGNIRSNLIYTVVPSRRGDSREAVVLVVATNWTAVTRAPVRASWGIGVGVVLAQYLKTVHWLSKDVIMVFVDSSLPYGAGARAWLQAYFGGSSAVRRGVLRQAVVLDIGVKATALLCDVEGINGMVPNQDIVNAYMVSTRDKRNLPVFHRESWASVFHHFRNGGVHGIHTPFLELQVPAFTIRGQRNADDKRAGRQALDVESLAKSLEGIVRCMSNNLQQLHHSFNFYFFTSASSHISSGLYLYPVFAMQLPLISFLLTSPAYRDIRSLLIGLGTIAVTIAVAGSPVFLLATDANLVGWLRSIAPVSAPLPQPPACEDPTWDEVSSQDRREAVVTWLSTGGAAAALVAFLLRQYAFRIFEDAKGAAQIVSKGVRLPNPLWEAVRAASGFAFLIVLAPVTIYSWSLAVPLTVVCVPVLVLVRPFSFRRRPVRSLLLLSFLVGNAFLFAVPPAARAELLGDVPGRAATWCYDFYEGTLLPQVPKEARKYMPTPLVNWLHDGQLGQAMQGDLLLSLHERARDYNCVGGMLFPVFCFVYWPLLILLILIGVVLPAQRVDDEGLTLREFRLAVLFVLSLLLSAVVGGVVWRSQTSSGLGKLQW